MGRLHRRIDERIKQLGLTYKGVSQEMSGYSAGYISNLLAYENDPTSSALMEIAGILKTTPNDLLGVSGRYNFIDSTDESDFVGEQAEALASAAHQRARERLLDLGARPSLREVVSWALNNDGQIAHEDAFARYVTLYKPPHEAAEMPVATHVGALSLARKTLGVTDADHLNRMMEQMPKDFTRKLSKSQITVNGEVPFITLERISVDVPKENVSVNFPYLRAYIKMRLSNGKPVILNYSEPID